MKILDQIEIGEPHEIHEIPTFTPDEIPQALQTCVQGGAAKVVNHLSATSIAALLNNVQFSDGPAVLDDFPAAGHLDYAEELRKLHDLVVTDNHATSDQKVRFTAITTPTADPDPETLFTGHLDTLSPFGITAISALDGPDALFVASPYPYCIKSNVFTQDSAAPPDFIGRYGIGDTVFIRQRIDALNGEPVELYAMIHEGIANATRHLLAMDFRFLDFNLPGAK